MAEDAVAVAGATAGGGGDAVGRWRGGALQLALSIGRGDGRRRWQSRCIVLDAQVVARAR